MNLINSLKETAVCCKPFKILRTIHNFKEEINGTGGNQFQIRIKISSLLI